MKIETFDHAKFIRAKIDNLDVKKTKISNTPKRDDDEDFNFILQTAFDTTCYAIDRLEGDFEKL